MVSVDENVSFQSDSDTSSEFSFVGYPTIIDENSHRISSSSPGDDQSVVGKIPDDDLEEDAPHQDDEPEDQHGDDNDDGDDVDHDDLNHGDDVRRDDNDDPDGHDEVHDYDKEPSRLATPPAIPCPFQLQDAHQKLGRNQPGRKILSCRANHCQSGCKEQNFKKI